MNALLRNFSIVAHIDHGKSTLADRLLLRAGAISEREFRHSQILDSMDLERERGITIKARAVALPYRYQDQSYVLNLIDTPGHVDFSYEVSRSLLACEGALLVVDATEGIQAQTVANAYLALEAGLEIIPVLNKIDLETARPDVVIGELQQTFGFRPEEVLQVSAKTGAGVDELFRALIERVPPPVGDAAAPLRALIFDGQYDEYRGVVVYVRVMEGALSQRDRIRMLATGRSSPVDELGVFTPAAMRATRTLAAGEVGYVITTIKSLDDVRVGDTLVAEGAVEVEPLPGYRPPQHMVFCGLYPAVNAEYDLLRRALDKLHLNDSSFSYAPESSEALGFGFRCGFLGLLHMEVVQERLERESALDLVQTAPTVTYEVTLRSGEVRRVESAAQLPGEGEIDQIREPIVKANLLLPAEFIGPVMKLAEGRRGEYRSTEYISTTRVMLVYELPLAEIVYDFHDALKSITRGYGTMDYEVTDYRAADMVRLRILVNSVEVDALSSIVHRSVAERRGRNLLLRLRKEIPRHLFRVPLQAACGGRIVAREDIPALAKDVTAKCYGGDISRKRKLLEKQKEGKKRMKSVGNVEIPQKAFLAVLAPDGQDSPGRQR